jgi:predicted metalloendopeptidase
MPRSPLALPLAALLLSCGDKAPPAAAGATDLPAYAQAVLSDMDLKANPCEDFYQYACGGWLARTPLPADKPSWTRSFSEITDSNEKFLKELLERAAKDPSAGDADWARMGHMYGACLNEDARSQAGLKALEDTFADISRVQDMAGVAKVTGQLHKLGVDVFFGAFVEGDFINPGLQILHLGQSGLSLPDRDYYVDVQDEKGKALLADFEAHVAKMLQMAGRGGAAEAKAVVAFEAQLAALHRPVEQLRDPTQNYNKVDRSGVTEKVGAFGWDAWLTALDGGHIQDISLDHVETFQKVVGLLSSTDPATLRAYMVYAVLRDKADALPPAYGAESFAFYGQKVTGTAQQPPLWKRCARATGGALGEVVGRFYVEARFAGASKQTAQTLIADVQDAFEAGLPGLTWMDEETRKAAIGKKDKLVNKIGFPDKWRDYSALQLGPGDHLANSLASTRFEHAEVIARASKPTDRSLWLMPPHMVNAYYHPLLNEMAFPAGILQPPFFDATYPSAMNYGSIGMVMGHELTHGFDDQGSMFDGDGQMRAWWAEGARKRFDDRTACVADFYGQFEIPGGEKVNGQLTNGENIADIGGLRVAYRAWKARTAADGGEPATVPGLTADQLFFVSFAQGWCNKSSDEYLTMQVRSDPHSPARYRVLGTAAQLPEFHAAFQCQDGAQMKPAKACDVW